MSSVLDKVQVESLMPLEYKYLLHVLLNFRKQSKFKLNIIVSNNSII